MKKLFTLLAAMLIAMGASAQSNTLQFCYRDGTVIPNDGTVVVTTPDEIPLMFGLYQLESGVYVKNNSANNVSASIKMEISSIEGVLSVCLGTQCFTYTDAGNKEVKNVMLNAGTINNLQCHWTPEKDIDDEPIPSKCDAYYIIYADGVECSRIRILFDITGDSTDAIKVPTVSATTGKIYNMAGQQVSDMSGHGIFIINGKKIKK